MTNPKFYPVVYFERKCKCGKNIKHLIYDYGLLQSLNEIDEKMGEQTFTITQIECSNCGSKDFPTHATLYDKISKKLLSKSVIGSEEMPVCGSDDIPYGTIRNIKDEQEIERGWDKLADCFKKNEKDFWEKYCAFGLSKWKQIVKEFNHRELSEGFSILGIPLIQSNASVTVWRREVINRFLTKEEKERAWKALNYYIIHKEFLWLRPDSWPINDFVKEYGRDRVQYIIMNIPLPEELEKCRTEALAKVIKKKSGETEILLERIGQLGKELDRQRNRSQALSLALLEQKQEKGLMESKLNKAYEKIKILEKERENDIERKTNRDPKDIQKIKDLKGLILELRERVEELEQLIPQETLQKEQVQTEESMVTIENNIEESNIDPATVLKGKTIGIFGFRGETVDKEYVVKWNPGDHVDYDLESLAREANIIVVLTRFISHAAMWRLKELAIDYDVPIIFLKETGIKRIIDEVTFWVGKPDLW